MRTRVICSASQVGEKIDTFIYLCAAAERALFST